jgi:hypothetical protein
MTLGFTDLLWLELQAWISDRTPQEQDSYLYVQRKKIPDILNRIMEYRFEPFYAPSSECSQFSGASSLHEAVTPIILILVLHSLISSRK